MQKAIVLLCLYNSACVCIRMSSMLNKSKAPIDSTDWRSISLSLLLLVDVCVMSDECLAYFLSGDLQQQNKPRFEDTIPRRVLSLSFLFVLFRYLCKDLYMCTSFSLTHTHSSMPCLLCAPLRARFDLSFSICLLVFFSRWTHTHKTCITLK